jgi:hypothetical protein
MLVWLDSFEVLAPQMPESSATLTDCTAATPDPLHVPKMPGFPAEERAASPTPKRRRRPDVRPSDDAPG